MNTIGFNTRATATAIWLALAAIPTNGANYELASGFDADSNPGAIWSCGWFSNIGGEFQPLTFKNTTASDNGVVLRAWQYSSSEQPAVNWNGTTNVAIVYGGLSSFAPGDVFLHPGPDGSPRNFGAVRFTLPLNESGLYRLEATAAAVLTNGPASDTDFYIVKDGREVVGWILPAGRGVGYTNQMQLAPGETVDFLIGRGADGHEYGGALKIRARFVPLNVVTSQPPVILTQPQSQTVVAGSNATFAVTAGGTPPLTYRWFMNGSALASATNSALALHNVQPAQAGDYRVVVANVAGSATSAVATLTVTGASNPVWDVSSFSVATNPGAVWSYGWFTNLGGNFVPLTYAKTSMAASGVPVQSWQYSSFEQPAVYWNGTTNNAVFNSGQSVCPPGTVWAHPGPDGSVRNYGVVRLTVPAGAAGVYRLESAFRALLDGGTAGDTEIHVLHNGVEIFGQSLAARAGTGFTNAIQLAVGDRVDFAVGRGQDGIEYGSALKIAARFVAEPVPPMPPAFDISNFSPEANPGPVWSYGWFSEVAGPFHLLTFAKGFNSDNGVAVRSWQYSNTEQPVVHWNSSTNPAILYGGQAICGPGGVWFHPGPEGSGHNFSAVRFTSPAGASGSYRLESAFPPFWVGASVSDTDIHVLQNGVEIFSQFLNSTNGTTFTNTLNLAAGDTVDFLIGRGRDNRYYGDGLKIQARFVALPAPPVPAVFDVSAFSPAANPGPVWSYGWFTNIGGKFTLLTYAKTPPADNGVPINSWQYSEYEQPVVAWNGTTNIAIVFGGQTAFPPGSVWFHPGPDGSPRNFGAIRFTMPAGGSGNYRLESAVAAVLTNSPAGDTDFHIVKNGTEVFGRFLPAGQGTGFTNDLMLATGDTVDFLVGRGEDGHEYGGALKIAARFAPVNVVTSQPPVIVSQPQSRSVVAGSNVVFTVTAVGAQPLNYRWLFNNGVIASATNSTLALNNVQPAQAGHYRVVVANAAGSVTSAVATLTVIVPPECAAPPPGLAAWWPLDGDAADIVGSNTGVLVGSPAFANGKVGPGLIFDGADDQVNVAPSPSLNVGAGDGFTLELWVNPTDPTRPQPLIEWNNRQGTAGLHLWIAQPHPAGSGPGSIFANLVDNGHVARWFPAPAGLLSSNTWTHVALTYEKASGIARIYADGVVVAQTNVGSLVMETTYELFLGRRVAVSGSNYYYRGGMDEISLYNRALSPGEIEGIYHAGAAGKCRTPESPVIVSQPQSRSVVAGSNVVFTVTAVGAQPLNYRWLFNNGVIASATNTSLAIDNVQLAQAGDYRAVVSNAVGSVTSAVATLTVVLPPGTVHDLAKDFSSTSNPNGVWRYGYKQVIGGSFSNLAYHRIFLSGESVPIQVWEFSPNGDPAVFLNGSTNTATSDGGAGVYPPGTVWFAPGFDGQPQNFGAIRFTVPPAGTGLYRLETSARTYLDRSPGGDSDFHVVKDGVALFDHFLATPSETGYTNVLSLVSGETIDFLVGRGQDGRLYGSGLKIKATLTRLETNAAPPVILTQPQSQTVAAGSSATFVVTAGGTPPLTYRWLMNGGALASATNSALALNNVQPGQAGDYRVVVANAAGSVTSAVATLTVTGIGNPVWDVSSFSVATNPGAVWSYGWFTNLGGNFVPLTYAKTSMAANGVPVQSWQYSSFEQPAVYWNGTTNTAVFNGGQSVCPPGTVWAHPGPDGSVRNFGVVRLTVPAGAAGVYRLESAFRALLDGGTAGDTEIHVLHNGVEIFGQNLAARAGTGYTNAIQLSVGDTMDFAVGRGQDRIEYGSALKIAARIVPLVGGSNQPLRVAGIEYLSNGQVQASVDGVLGTAVEIQVSTNLSHWSPLANGINRNGSIRFADPERLRAPMRFYRARPTGN